MHNPMKISITIIFQIIIISESLQAQTALRVATTLLNRHSTKNYSRRHVVISSQSIENIEIEQKQKSVDSKVEDINLLAKESFFCFRMEGQEETCIVECKRRDEKPFGFGLKEWSSISDDSGQRRAFAFAQSRDPLPKNYSGPCLIHIREIPFSYGKLGGSVWYASIALAQYLSSKPSIIKGKNVLELGAGVGIPGLLAAKCSDGAKSVTLSEFGLEGEVDGMVLEDREDKRLLPSALLNNLEYNAEINGLTDKVSIRHLDWYDYCPSSAKRSTNNRMTEEDKYDLIIGADLVNWEDDVVPLIETLKYFLYHGSGNAEALIALSGENRRALPEFLDTIQKEFRVVNVMNTTLIHYDEHPVLIISLEDPLYT